MINGDIAIGRDDGSGFIVELKKFLDFSDSMTDSILVLIQARLNNVIINDIPKSLCPYKVSTQSVIFPDPELEIPIEYNGPNSFFRGSYPTDSDMDTYKWVIITSTSDWDPYSLA